MSSPAGFAHGIACQVASTWNTLSPETCFSIAELTEIALPPPWERFSVASQDALAQSMLSETARIGQVVSLLQAPAVIPNRELPEDEREALRVFRSAEPQELNALLWDLHLSDRLHDVLNDFESGILFWSNKRAVIRLLTRDRVKELTIPVRAALILAMQKGITGRVMEEGITCLIEGTTGADLTRLKHIIDRGSPQDLVKLIHDDVGSRRLRSRILRHFDRQASSVQPEIPLIVSDIDDTVFCNWKDARYPSKSVYPGVRAFYRAMGRLDRNDWEKRGPIFNSARPGEPTGMVEAWTIDTLNEIGFPFSTVLSGDLLHIIGASMAVGKLENFVRHDRLFPEFWKVLVGDNGQHDVEFISQALTVYPSTALAGFIHDIGEIPSERPKAYTFEELTAPAGDRRLFYFDTYVGAALAAYEMQPQLISLFDLQQVVLEAVTDFNLISFDSDEQKGRMQSLLQRDLDVVRGIYGLSGR